jgi:hypothetical protein
MTELVDPHPHGARDDPSRGRTTRWFARNWQRLDGLVDRFELFNRRQTFGWVAEAGLPGIATGDFHRLRAPADLEDATALRQETSTA